MILSIDELKRKYPHAANNITEAGLLRADKQTLETWEFEGELCDSVIKAVGSHVCPRCTGRVWRIGETIVNFYFPFTNSMRVHAYGLLGKRPAWSVTCVTCGLRRRLKK